MKRKWLHELPYLLIALYATKIGQAWRLAEGTDAAHKLLSLMDSLSASFASPLPSFELHDLCIGLLLGACFRLFIFIKESEKKKYRKGREYVWYSAYDGSAYHHNRTSRFPVWYAHRSCRRSARRFPR